MPAPPPPPPPMPPMGRGAGGPPPPPPMPGRAPGGKPPSGAGRGALLGDINKGTRLKKVTQINDRSAPQVGKVSDGPSGPPIGGAPPVPGMGRAPAPPSGLAPPVPGNRARSNSDTGGDGGGMASAAPQLAGLFAAGMPKLRKAGGVKTGAETNSPYLSDPETSRSSAPKPPRGAAPKPPGGPPPPPGAAPPVPGGRPPPNPSISALRNNLRPSSVVSTHSMFEIGSKPKPPPPGKKPPIPPPSSRKPSGLAPPPPASPARAPPVPGGAPPRLPPTHTPSAPPPPRPVPAHTPSAPPPPPPAAAPRAPPVRSTPPPPPLAPPTPRAQPDDDEYDPYRYSSGPPKPPSAPAPPAPKAPTNGHSPSLAEQAARNAFGRASPAAPPPPPPASLPPSAPSAPAPPPPPTSPPSRPATQPPVRSLLDPSSYTLTNGGSGGKSGPTSPGIGAGAGQKGKIIPVHDLRWRFVDESQFPNPRGFTGGAKRYRAGRGSSVPLDLSAFE